ncbi:MAG: hypothetical protein IKN24_02355 [Lachnospiraceae bacterium]|nr:hypothetical protein [Lachnospiraceae bacterium]
MTKEDLISAFNDIDDRYLEEGMEPMKRETPLYKKTLAYSILAAALAACMFLAVRISGAGIAGSADDGNMPSEMSGDVSQKETAGIQDSNNGNTSDGMVIESSSQDESQDTYVYDVIGDSGIDREIIEREVNRIMEDRKNSTGNPFTVASYDLDKAYVAVPMQQYKMITFYRNGGTLEEMASERKQLIVPVTSEEGRPGYITFDCFGKHLTYLGMSMSYDTDIASGLVDMARLLEVAGSDGRNVKDVDIYKNELYHLYIISVETDEGRLMTATYGGKHDMEAYKLYTEEEFWSLMYATYDEDGMDPDSDGGVPLRKGSVPAATGKSTSQKNTADNTVVTTGSKVETAEPNVLVYALVGAGALLGIIACSVIIVRKKKTSN